jgi:hypothetical protein
LAEARASDPRREVSAVKCDICNAEIANSEELKAHMEHEHPLDERNDEALESPDLAPDKDREPVVVPGVPGRN